MHVINPVLPLIDDILSAATETNDGKPILHYSWMLVILQRSFTHESKVLNKWALHYCLKSDLYKHLVSSKRSLHFIFADIVKALQPLHIYNREEHAPWGSPPLILDFMVNFISNCLAHIGSNQLMFVNMVLDAFSSSSFNEISLIYFTEALSHQTLSYPLTSVEFSKFKQLCLSKISVYRIEYQRVIFQNLSSFFVKNMPSEKSVIIDAINLMGNAVDKGYFTLNGKCWLIWLSWMSQTSYLGKDEIFTVEIENYLHSNVTLMKWETSVVNATGFSILVLFHSGICTRTNIKVLLPCLNDVILKLHTNPYLDSKKVLKVLEITNSLFRATLNYSPSNVHVSHIFPFLVSCLPNILQYIVHAYTYCNERNNYSHILQQCLQLLQYYIITSSFPAYGEINMVLKKFFEKNFDNLILSNLQSISKYFAEVSEEINCDVSFPVKLLRYYSEWESVKYENPSYLCSLLVSLLIKCDRRRLNAICKNSENGNFLTCDSVISNLWYSLMKLLERNNVIDSITSQKRLLLLDTYFSDITIVSHEHILDVTKFATIFVPMFVDHTEQLIDIIDYMWKVVKDQSQTDHSFWKIYINCIQCIFHENLLLSAEPDIINKLKEIWGYILMEGERKIRVINIFITHTTNIWSRHVDRSSEIMVNYVDELISTYIFGPLTNKCAKPIDDMIYYLKNSDKYDDLNELEATHGANKNVRVIMINYLLNLTENASLDDFFNRLKLTILEKEVKFSRSRKCYYPNTMIHRRILRLWQLYLILLGKCSNSYDYKSILPQLYASVKTAYQTSIRYLIEWCILLIFQNDNELVGTLLDVMEKGSEKQILSVTSIMSISIHLAGLLKGKQFEMFVKRAVPKVLPWSHAQHMTSRIYAQVVLEKIWENIVESDNQSLKDEFHFLSYCFSLKVDNTAAVKNRLELKGEFYYSQLQPIQHYSLETVFHIFPANADVLNDEWITVDCFEYNGDSLKSSLKPFKLRGCNELDLSTLNLLDDSQSEDICNRVDEKLVDLQKKIMPWRVLPPTDDHILQSELEQKKDSKSSQLILCAVLVDKIPNLGGLCRTSEIFGVGTLIVGSHRYLEDKGFKSLSVSAERWLNIEQVLPIKLASYLEDMKKNGYQIVGVEQTANSKMIGQFKFAEKSMLLLGNEKTGIPVDLIQLVDVCVEIPQVGIIRSLNVHISGALMIWEYCKQHVLDIV